MLVYNSDGRFDRVVPARADIDKEMGTSESYGKAVEAATHWKLLGSSVRLLLPLRLRVI